VQLSLFDAMNVNGESENNSQECYVPTNIEQVWKEEKDVSNQKPPKFKFDVVIGNPPYQEEVNWT
jgi:23S rRNA G2445 N2-methylase RlmL